MDWGTASRYEIKYSTVFDDLRVDNFGSAINSTLVLQQHVINGSLQPLESGSRQIISFVLKDDSNSGAVTYFIALRAVDRSGQAGQASNIVSAQFYSNEPASGLSKQALIGIIVGSVFGAILIAAVLYLIARKRYNSYTEADTGPKP